MFEKYYGLYMKNMVSLTTLDKLVSAGKLSQDEVNKMIDDRLKQFGY